MSAQWGQKKILTTRLSFYKIKKKKKIFLKKKTKEKEKKKN